MWNTRWIMGSDRATRPNEILIDHHRLGRGILVKVFWVRCSRLQLTLALVSVLLLHYLCIVWIPYLIYNPFLIKILIKTFRINTFSVEFIDACELSLNSNNVTKIFSLIFRQVCFSPHFKNQPIFITLV